MRVHVCAVGRVKSGPEATLISDYTGRFHKTGRGLGLTFGGLSEVEDRKGGGKDAEAQLLRRSIPKSATLWVLDERGTTLSSPDFASALAKTRDTGTGDLAICIGGADGFAADFRNEAQRTISFGAMVWPHMLARVMLAEQLYRAVTILAGTPYHRA